MRMMIPGMANDAASTSDPSLVTPFGRSLAYPGGGRSNRTESLSLTDRAELHEQREPVVEAEGVAPW
jgi:hypothetical protein